MNSSFLDRLKDWASTGGLRIVAIVLLAVVFYYFLRGVFRRLLKVVRKVSDSNLVTREQEMRARTLAGIIRGLLIAVIVVAVVLITLSELGYNVAPLLAGAGIAGLAIGLGAQTLMRDFIGGFFVLLEGQFNVGDLVKIGEVMGKVEAIKLRTTLIRDSEGVLNIVPNGEMRVVSNLAKGWSRVNIDVNFDLREDIDTVIGIIQEAARGAAQDDSAVAAYILEGPDVLGIEALEGKMVTVRIVARIEPFRDAEVAREIRRRVAVALAANKISFGGE
ncbi:MAG: mechanosensitive ion channel family protein [Actinobacteria bacterium]|nr:mechanosensitive ion channel family protein [Actinomycetota bacterium]